MKLWFMPGLGWLAMAIVMSGLWRLQKRTGRSGIVDVAWSLGVGVLAVFYCWAARDGLIARRVVVSVLAMIWATRLGWHIGTRLQQETDDGRYLALRAKWGDRFQSRLFWFYQFQALGAMLFALPMLLAATNTQPLGVPDLLGVVVWVVAIGGEAVADAQLKRFKTAAANKGRVCQHGLWRYSRHPNYFFEWLHWWSYVCFAVAAPWGWTTMVAPLAMLYFILRVTGIPPTERQSLNSRGDAYRQYQRTTSAFFPWLPKAN